MNITKVTMTGADDSINPEDLLSISERYPFVEWGILLSRNSQGKNRFPSKEWMDRLSELNTESMFFSGHICGRYAKEMLMGNNILITEVGAIWNLFQRIQINTHGQPHKFDKDSVANLKMLNKEIIFQYDGVNKPILDHAILHNVNCSTLFDMSHGNGVTPDQWPMPIEGVRCGYAGGLSPDNVKDEIQLIETMVGDYHLWIDMETKIRSDSDKQFDLDKVVAVLDIVSNMKK